MIETIVTGGVAVVSLLLFCYWFQYTCHLILSAITPRDYSASIAEQHHLHFADTRHQLTSGSPDLNNVRGLLERDYAVLVKLIDTVDAADSGIETRMLAVHFRLTSTWYTAVRSVSPSAARRAVDEMTAVVAHFANSLGEAVTVPAGA